MAKESGGVVDAFWKGAAGAAGSAVLLWLLGWLDPAWSFATGILRSIWVHLTAQSLWPNWSAYVLSLTAAISISCLAFRYWLSNKRSRKRFQQLSFLGAVWRWRDMSSLVYTLRPYCPSCDTLLVYYEGAEDLGGHMKTQWRCQRCNCVRVNADGFKADVDGQVMREIDRLLRSGQWRRHGVDLT